jgi:hypothetical protein
MSLLKDLPVDGPSRRLGFTDAGQVYADIPADDLATAGRVLTLITSRLDSARA